MPLEIKNGKPEKCFATNQSFLKKAIIENGEYEVKICLTEFPSAKEMFKIVAKFKHREYVLHIGLGNSTTKKAAGQYHKYISWSEQIISRLTRTI